MSRIAVIGAGYVGLTTAVCLAHLGHDVICADISPHRIGMLEAGEAPLVEEGLPDLLRQGLESGLLRFSSDNVRAVTDAEFVFICVPTPQSEDGRADMSFVEAVASEIGSHLLPGSVVINKSTLPVGSTRVVESMLRRADIAVVSNPEFLREGSAIHDFLHPDRIVIGADDDETAQRVSRVLVGINAPVMVTDPASAETIKYASNAFLATKISFVNAIAALCESLGADIRQVVLGMSYDPRIGTEFLRPGPGWGGSCFPKDTAALMRIADDVGYEFDLLRGVISANQQQRIRVVDKVRRMVGGTLKGKIVALWGLTFKAGTDDLRDSPALEVARLLIDEGARLQAYDPAIRTQIDGISLSANAYGATENAHVIVIATEWDEFRTIDFTKVAQLMESPNVVDARNLLEPAVMRQLGFTYEGIGML